MAVAEYTKCIDALKKEGKGESELALKALSNRAACNKQISHALHVHVHTHSATHCVISRCGANPLTASSWCLLDAEDATDETQKSEIIIARSCFDIVYERRPDCPHLNRVLHRQLL